MRRTLLTILGFFLIMWIVINIDLSFLVIIPGHNSYYGLLVLFLGIILIAMFREHGREGGDYGNGTKHKNVATNYSDSYLHVRDGHSQQGQVRNGHHRAGHKPF